MLPQNLPIVIPCVHVGTQADNLELLVQRMPKSNLGNITQFNQLGTHIVQHLTNFTHLGLHAYARPAQAQRRHSLPIPSYSYSCTAWPCPVPGQKNAEMCQFGRVTLRDFLRFSTKFTKFYSHYWILASIYNLQNNF